MNRYFGLGTGPDGLEPRPIDSELRQRLERPTGWLAGLFVGALGAGLVYGWFAIGSLATP